MVSRRNFLVITTMMLVLFFLFQFSGVIKENWNEYEDNQYAEITQTNWNRNDVYDAEGKNAFGEETQYMVFIGDVDGSIAQVIREWCGYAKQGFRSYTSLAEWEQFGDEQVKMICLDSAFLDFASDMPALKKLTEQGIHLIFCSLPDSSVIAENKELSDLLGISQVVEETISLVGMRLFRDFFVGGGTTYQAVRENDEKRQDLDLDVPWYILGSGTKTYMMGLLEDGEIDNELLPGIIWRNSIGNSRVFAVNGTFMEDSTGLGILSAMQYESSPYVIYPIVNAQNMVFLNYPLLASENDTEMYRRYSRSQKDVLRDIVWPGIVAVSEQNHLKVTCMLNPQLNYDDEKEPQESDLLYYMKMMRNQNFEIGLSSSQVSDRDILEKTELDYEFLQEHIKDYQFLSFYQDKTPTLDHDAIMQVLQKPLYSCVRTLVKEYGEAERMISYIDEDVTLQSAVVDGFRHTYSDNLRVRSLETVLGYSNVVVDMKKVVFPKTQEESWELLYDDFSSNSGTYWEPFVAFDHTTLAESDKRIRNFLALDYKSKWEEDTIYLDIENFNDEAWFILRTHGSEVESVEGAEYEMIEPNVYLLSIHEEQVVIQLSEHRVRYYE